MQSNQNTITIHISRGRSLTRKNYCVERTSAEPRKSSAKKGSEPRKSSEKRRSSAKKSSMRSSRRSSAKKTSAEPRKLSARKKQITAEIRKNSVIIS